jgi:UDP-glucose 4-epimerase
MSKVSVLVTGGAGYIGSHAVLALRDAGWDVAVIDNLSTGTRYVVPDDVPFYEGSVADRELVDRIFAERNIGAILHFAGSIVVPESVEKPLEYYRNNTVASHALISAAVEAGVKHIVFSSTAAVYGEPERVPVDEAVQKLPINPYGASKLMTERMLEDSAAAYPMNYAALRYFNVSGADPAGRSGQVGKGSTHLIKVAVEAAVGKRDHIDVYGTDYPTEDGSCVRDYIHVSDLVAAHVKALERLIEKPDENLVLNLGYGRGLSVLEVLDALDRLLPEPIRREMKGRRAGDPPLLISSNRALTDTLDWQARYADIDTILTHALEWERKLLSRNWA